MDLSTKLLKECGFYHSDSTCLCFKCVNYFCDNCFKLIHSLEKNLSHKKENIDLFIPIDIRCNLHPSNPLNLFCVEEKGKNKLFNII